MLDYVGLCWIMLDYVGLCWIMLDYVGLCWIMLDYVGLCWVMLDYRARVFSYTFHGGSIRQDPSKPTFWECKTASFDRPVEGGT